MNQSKQENLIYLAVWTLLFAAPLLSLYVRTMTDPHVMFNWTVVFIIWKKFAIYLVLFLIHNYLLAPLLVNKRKRALFFSVTTCIIILFAVYQCNSRPNHPKFEKPATEQIDDMPPFHDALPPMDDFKPNHHGPKFKHNRPPAIIGEHDIIAVVLLILMFGMNLGIKFYVRSREDQKKMMRLEKENLIQQLEYLKYQLNPHFLMNTLNNIHALIDIDSAKAQEAVIQLSKILRYVLYDSNKSQVLMSQELDFMDSYVRLMRMRYTDKLHFSVKEPDSATSLYVAPLLFISFVENAFKHGVSYQQDSFIDIEWRCITNDEGNQRLLWTCRNSKHPKQQDTGMPSQGGVGMINIRQRLNLIYGNDYTLNIHETADTYEVELNIPLNNKKAE